MQKFNSLSDAIRLAEFAHGNQLDKAGLPYIEHPKRVLAKVQAQGALPYVQIAAVLHDVTEDTPFTPEMLISLGFSEAAVEVVKLVDRHLSAERFKNDERRLREDDILYGVDDPEDYYYLTIRLNPAARMVKLADIEDNMSPWRLGYLSKDTQARLTRKYKRARLILDNFMSPAEAVAHIKSLDRP